MMSEMPLALFTTLAPIGAGAFVALAVAFCSESFSDDAVKKIDKFTLIPTFVVIAGFICAFFHLANPLHAMNVFNGVGSSPMSNELVAACVFALVMIVYQIVALAGKLSASARKGFLVVVAVLAIVFALFCGAAYMIDTIPSWNTPMGPVQVLGYELAGGAALGALVLACSGALGDAEKTKKALAALAIVGAILGIVALIVMVQATAGMSNAVASGADLAAGVTGFMVVSSLCVAAAAICTVASRKNAVALPALACVLAVVGVLVGRLAFYGLEISVGLFF